MADIKQAIPGVSNPAKVLKRDLEMQILMPPETPAILNLAPSPGMEGVVSALDEFQKLLAAHHELLSKLFRLLKEEGNI